MRTPSRMISGPKRSTVVLLSVMAAALASTGQDLWTVHNFTGADGAWPFSRIGKSGDILYGATSSDDMYSSGVIYSVRADGTAYRVLKRFPDAGLWPVLLAGTTLYGSQSPPDRLFKMNCDGSGFVILKEFIQPADGFSPAPVLVSDTVLYGTTQGGVSNTGSIFRINNDGTGFTTLKTFTGPDGASPSTVLLSGSTLFGTTLRGGIADQGIVFRVESNGSGFRVLKTFSGFDGAYPGDLVLSGTTLYGLTSSGGPSGFGIIYKINVDGTGFTWLKQFTNSYEGLGPSALFLCDGKLYGSTAQGGPLNDGTLFSLELDGTSYQVVQTFTNSVYQPVGLFCSGSALYGVGSLSGSKGVVFGWTVPTLEPTIVVAPGDQTAVAGSGVSLSAHISGAAPLYYRWLFNQADAGETSGPVLQLDAVLPSQSGAYFLVVTNAYGAVTSAPAVLTVISPGNTVSNCSETALRLALAAPGPVKFACDGLITLGNTIKITGDTVLDGSGHDLTISGANLVRVFEVESNRHLTLLNLRVADGFGTNGGAIHNNGGTVDLLGVVLAANTSISPGQENWCGGALFNSGGAIHATNCLFSNNNVWGNRFQGGRVLGGAVYSSRGSMVFDHCRFEQNTARAGPFYYDAAASGGAIYSEGDLTVVDSALYENSVIGNQGPYGSGPSNAGGWWLPPSNGGTGGTGAGGAIYSLSSLKLERVSLVCNQATGGTGGSGGNGNSGIDLREFTFSGASGGPGGLASGAALFNGGTAALINCTLAWNTASGGQGGSGGWGGVFRDYGGGSMPGGWGGMGGNSYSGIYSTNAHIALTNCTLACNSAQPGSGGPGGSGQPVGGSGPSGTDAAATRSQGAMLINTLLAAGSPRNWAGSLTDAGHNLSSDLSCGFTNAGSMNNRDPLLGPLQDNGGPTLTMALLPGSPAIDAGDNASAPATDQRGFPRPIGAAADIGAYEFGSPAYMIMSLRTAEAVELVGTGVPGRVFWLETSTDLLTWVSVATNQFNATGTALFENVPAGDARRFYRLQLP